MNLELKKSLHQCCILMIAATFGVLAIFASGVGLYRELGNTAKSLETTRQGAILSPSEALDEEICDLNDVDCDIEGVIRDIARAENFAWPDYLVRLAHCESGMKPLTTGDGGYRSRGLFQISEYYHPDVSDDCAFDVECATRWTIAKINAGQQGLWSCDKIVKNIK